MSDSDHEHRELFEWPLGIHRSKSNTQNEQGTVQGNVGWNEWRRG